MYRVHSCTHHGHQCSTQENSNGTVDFSCSSNLNVNERYSLPYLDSLALAERQFHHHHKLRALQVEHLQAAAEVPLVRVIR